MGVVESAGSPRWLEVALLGREMSPRTRKMLAGWAACAAAWRVGQGWYTRARSESVYQVVVSSRDDLYRDLQSWLVNQITERERRSLEVRTVNTIAENGQPQSDLWVLYDGKRTQRITLDGYRVSVTLEQENFSLNNLAQGERLRLDDRLVFEASCEAARDAVVSVLRELAASRSKRPPRVYGVRWEDWVWLTELPTRPADSVVLKKGIWELLSEDLGSFLAAEGDYARFGIPWHRGYLFHGPPGCGKTSVAGVLASHFGLDMYALPLNSLRSDASLMSLMSRLQPRSLLVLEDIDTVRASHNRDGADGVTLGGLLNCLDGALTPHGMVTIMTTNNTEGLDPALVRPGRVDLSLAFEHLDDDQFQRLLALYGVEGDGLPSLPHEVPPAVVVDVLKRHLARPNDAVAELAELLS